jgi:hypothetical protein
LRTAQQVDNHLSFYQRKTTQPSAAKTISAAFQVLGAYPNLLSNNNNIQQQAQPVTTCIPQKRGRYAAGQGSYIERLQNAGLNYDWLSTLYMEQDLEMDIKYLTDSLKFTGRISSKQTDTKLNMQNSTLKRQMQNAVDAFVSIATGMPHWAKTDEYHQVILSQLSLGLSELSTAPVTESTLEIFRRVLLRDRGRLMVSLYDWFTSHAPSLFSHLWDAWWECNQDEELLTGKFPTCAPLFISLFKQLESWSAPKAAEFQPWKFQKELIGIQDFANDDTNRAKKFGFTVSLSNGTKATRIPRSDTDRFRTYLEEFQYLVWYRSLLHHCIEPLWKEEFNSKALSRNDSNSRF